MCGKDTLINGSLQFGEEPGQIAGFWLGHKTRTAWSEEPSIGSGAEDGEAEPLAGHPVSLAVGLALDQPVEP
jgi:hypothetical protein